MDCLRLSLIWVSIFGFITASHAVEPEPKLKIGVILPLTGPVASMGENPRNAISLIGRSDVEFLFQDDQCLAQKALTAYQLLRSQGVRLFIVNCSGSILAIAPLAKKNGDLIVTGYAGSSEIRATGPEVIRFNSDALSMGIKIAEGLAAMPDRRYGLLSEEQDYAESIATIITEKLGNQIVHHERYRSLEPTYRTQLLKLRRPDIDAIIMVPTSDHAAKIIYKEYVDLRINKPLYGEANLCDFAINPREFGIHGHCWRSVLITPGMKRFLERYRAKFTSGPQYPVNDALTYDAASIVAELGVKYDGDPAKIAAGLLAGIKGEIADYSFEPNGEVISAESMEVVEY